MSASNEDLINSIEAIVERYQADSILLLRNDPGAIDLQEWANHTKSILEMLLDHTLQLTAAVIETRS